MQPAVISEARLAAAHEGVAELIVTLRHSNGGTSDVALDRYAAQSLLKACAASTLEELCGHSWETVRDALSASYNRLQGEHTHP